MQPTAFGPYSVVMSLGSGGMADVYLARDAKLDRLVAVKAPHRELVTAEIRARFRREAHAAAALEHPAIVPVYDYDESGELPYIVMRYLTGGSLADLLERRRLSLNEVVKIVDRISSALDLAHSLGVLHGDVNPRNILFDEAGAAYLSDFGIARMMESDGKQRLTRAEKVIGTAPYMSPEKVLGKPLDGRSDIYALGVVLFEMLTGQPPYTSESHWSVIQQHVNEPIPSIRRWRPDLPPALQRLVDRALAKQPEERYQTAGALAEDLRRIAERLGAAAMTVPDTTRMTVPIGPVPSAGPASFWFVKWIIFGVFAGLLLAIFPLLRRNPTDSQDAMATRIAASEIQAMAIRTADAAAQIANQTAIARSAMTATAQAIISLPTDTPKPPPTDTPQPSPADLIAVVNLVQQEQPDGTVINRAELEYKSLGLGEMEVIAPEVMTVGQSDTVMLWIVPGSALPDGQPITIYPDDSNEVEPTPRVNAPIDIYPLMTATLSGGDLAYLVESTSSDTHPILSDTPSVWTWLVTPLKPGEHQLTLTISVPVRVNGAAGVITTDPIRILNLDIEVDRNLLFWLILAAIVIVVVLLLYALYRYIIRPRWQEAQYAADKVLVALVDDLNKGLDEEEARDLAYRMGYKFEDLDVGNKMTKLRSLVIKCARRKQIDELVCEAKKINNSANLLAQYQAALNVGPGEREQGGS